MPIEERAKGLLARLRRLQARLYTHRLLPGGPLALPDFLGIGAPQCGTTWLHHNLRQHPDLYLPEVKEIHYFDLLQHRGLLWYARHFEAGQGRLKGEITPLYSLLAMDSIRYVRQLLPAVRLIYLVRNPIERAWSTARRNLSHIPRTRLESIEEPVLLTYLQTERVQGLHGMRALHGYPPDMRRGDYSAVLDHWTSVFPAEQIYVGLYEDIVTRPRELLAEVLAHIGASTNVDWESFPLAKVVNKSPELPMPDRIRAFLAELYAPEIQRMRERLGGKVSIWS